MTRSERERDAWRKRQERAAGRDVQIPPPANKARRARMEKDVYAWLRWYLAERFDQDFTEDQRAMVQAILTAARYGGDQALAAPRGEGKTTITESVVLYCILTGILHFAVILSATGPDAERILHSIKEELEDNERLRADYPEVCVPVYALENNPNRAHGQTVSGRNGKTSYSRHRSKFKWCGREIYLPNVPGSRARKAIIATRGLDSAVRGLKVGVARPDLAAIDDPDTDETVANEEQAGKLEKKIDRSVAGLAGQRKGLARVMLVTLQNRKCVSAKYTDPKQKPSWKGKRFSFLRRAPEREDLWEEYVALRQANLQEGDEFARKAHQFYVDRREEMDRGAEVSNPSRYSPIATPDGSAREISALEFYYNFVADKGLEAALSELQNDPPVESGPVESGITAWRVQRQVSGYERRVVPPGCVKLTQGIDVRKLGLHFVVRAWCWVEGGEAAVGYVIDYGFHETHGTQVGSEKGLDGAIIRALHERRENILNSPYLGLDDRPYTVDLTLVDAGWRTEAIYRFTTEAGLAFKPAMGFGKSAGCASPSFTSPVRTTNDKQVGHHWFLSRQPSGVWLACLDADYWKGWEHDRWMTEPGRPGSLLLHGQAGEDPERLSADQKSHFAYAKHITAETEVEEVVKGRLVRRWKSKSDTNHYLDASTMADAAASMVGVPIAGAVIKQARRRKTSLAALAGKK